MKVVIKMHVREVFTALYINFDFIFLYYIELYIHNVEIIIM